MKDTNEEAIYMTQLENIKKHLEDGNPISALEALDLYKCFRLSAHIHTLRKEYGMNIITNRITKNGKWFAQYSIAK